MNENILCVDDDQTVLVALRAVLAPLGPDCSILLAASGEEAIEIEADLRAQGLSLAVVIADFHMPGMRGDAMLMRLHELSPSTVKILLTGQSDFDGVKRAINQANLYRFLEKPFDNEDLLLTVKSAVEAFSHAHELQRQNQQLQALNHELREALARLDQQQAVLARSEAKGAISTLVAGVMHELNTPMGVSVLAADTIDDSVKTIKEALQSGPIRRSDLSTFIATVEEGCAMARVNLQRATDLMRDFKQMATDQASERQRVFDLGFTVREILASMAPTLRNKTQRVVVDINTSISMNSLPGALGQIVVNLVNNAFLHAFEGRPDGVMTIRAQQQGDQVELCFSDNGVGVPAENLALLREPFFSTKIGRGGTGLGLSIVESLVRNALRGTLQIHSELGEGTTFLLQLPCTLPKL